MPNPGPKARCLLPGSTQQEHKSHKPKGKKGSAKKCACQILILVPIMKAKKQKMIHHHNMITILAQKTNNLITTYTRQMVMCKQIISGGKRSFGRTKSSVIKKLKIHNL